MQIRTTQGAPHLLGWYAESATERNGGGLNRRNEFRRHSGLTKHLFHIGQG